MILLQPACSATFVVGLDDEGRSDWPGFAFAVIMGDEQGFELTHQVGGVHGIDQHLVGRVFPQSEPGSGNAGTCRSPSWQRTASATWRRAENFAHWAGKR